MNTRETHLTVRGNVDERAIEQAMRCAEAGFAPYAVVNADGHVGYSQSIGAAIGYTDFISPSGVGYDIGCGNKAVKTNIRYEDIDLIVPKLMDEIFERISFGMGRKNNEPVDHPVLADIDEAPFEPQRKLAVSAAKQLGTVGGGNHYVDLFSDDDGWVWVGAHFGSRGFGHKTATGFLSMAQGGSFDAKAPEGEMDSPPILLRVGSDIGQAYITAMQLAGEFAYAGRDVVVDKVLEILGADSVFEVHNHHNFAWKEEHFGQTLWVVRKGCTPAFPGQQGFVGATMGEDSVILEGVDSALSKDLLYSTVHGAGRLMSRTQAAGKKRKRWTCNNRDCDWYQGVGEHVEQAGKPNTWTCPKCGHVGMTKRWHQMAEGQIDWSMVLADMAEQGIELRGGAADEAPLAYKRLNEVLAAQGESIKVNVVLHPIGVAMAGADVEDPWKD